jgi:hypothetical protein
MLKPIRYAATALAFALAPLYLQPAHAAPVVLSFSTVGDSRQDPKNPDPSQMPVSGQDANWLQNTKAWSRIIRSVEAQKSDFLFFNGDIPSGTQRYRRSAYH